MYLIDYRENKAHHFFYDKNDANSISDNRIKDIFEDEKGRIWVGCHREGFCLYRPETNDFQRFKPSRILGKEEHSSFIDDVLSFEFRKDKLWIGTLDNVLSFDPNNGVLDHIEIQKMLINPEGLVKPTLSVRNMLWIDDHRFLFNSYAGENVVFLYDDLEKRSQVIWLTPKDSTFRGNANTPYREGNFVNFPCDSWMAKVNIENFSVSWIDNSITHANIPFDLGNFYLEGGEDRKWVIDSRNIYLLEGHPPSSKFLGLPHEAEKLFHLKENEYLFWHPGHTRGGMVNLENGKIEEFNQPLNPIKGRGNRTEQFFRIVDNQIITNNQDALQQWNNQTKQFEELIDLKPFVENNKLGDFISGFLDSKNIYWLGTKNSGIVRVNLKTKEITLIKNVSNEPEKIVFNGYPSSFYEDDLGNVWYATVRGFGYFDYQTQQFVNFPFESYSTNHPRINFKSISSIKKDKKNRIWLTDTSEGLGYFEFGEKAPQIKLIGEKEGLWDSSIGDIEIDHAGDIWVTHWHGVSRVFAEDLEVENYGREWGINRQVSIENLADGKIAFIDDGMAIIIKPDSMQVRAVDLKPVIYDFKVFDESLDLNESWFDVEEINLSYSQNFFSIDFSAINFSNPFQSEIQYKLEGVQKDWIDANNRTYTSFANVGSGTYEFKVRARIKNTKWSKPRTLKILIAAPFWETWWFYFLIFGLISAIVYSIYLVKVRQIREKEQLKSQFQVQLAEVEMVALRAQMNPHFLFNCLNSIKLFIVENNTQIASDYLTKFSKLIRLILQNSKRKLVLLSDELEALKLYIEMEKMRFDNQFEYQIIVAENVSPHHLEIPQLILQPFVENAIWHGLVHEDRANKLKVIIKKDDQKLTCIIEDNGIGRAEAQNRRKDHQSHKKSMGMAITKNRIELTKKLYKIDTKVEILDLEDEKRGEIGTKVVLSVPLIYCGDGEK